MVDVQGGQLSLQSYVSESMKIMGRNFRPFIQLRNGRCDKEHTVKQLFDKLTF